MLLSGTTASFQQAQGRRIGQYELIQRIGGGGFGDVYRALHTRLQKEIVVKLMSPRRLQHAESRDRFLREMESIGRLNHHPHIVQAFDAGDVDGVLYLAMELVDGHDMEQVARTEMPLAVADACEVVRQASLGLQHIFEHGMVHRDVKPSNLLLGAAGVKIADLGLALLADDEGGFITSTDVVMGTLDYISPEQAASSHHVDIRSDLYSLGCTFFRLLSGRPPFHGEAYSTPLKKLTAHSLHPPPDVRELRTDVPESLGELVSALLSKRTEDRPASPGELAARLHPHCVDARLDVLWQKSMLLRDCPAEDSPAGPPPPPSPQLTPRSFATPATPLAITDPATPQPVTVPVTPSPHTDTAAPPPPATAEDGFLRRWNRVWMAVFGMAGFLCLLTALIVSGRGDPNPKPDAGDGQENSEGKVGVNAAGPIPDPAPHPKEEPVRQKEPEEERPQGLTAQKWMNVFGQPPVEAAWEGIRGRGSWRIDEKLKSLVVDTERTMRFVEFGRIKEDQKDRIRIAFDCELRSKTGSFGCFFGFRTFPDDLKPITRVQVVGVRMGRDGKLTAHRYIGVIDGSDGSARSEKSTFLDLPEDLPQPFRIELVIRSSSLESVRVADFDCSFLCRPEANAQYLPGDMTGPFGAYSSDSTVWLSNPSFQRDVP